MRPDEVNLPAAARNPERFCAVFAREAAQIRHLLRRAHESHRLLADRAEAPAAEGAAALRLSLGRSVLAPAHHREAPVRFHDHRVPAAAEPGEAGLSAVPAVAEQPGVSGQYLEAAENRELHIRRNSGGDEQHFRRNSVHEQLAVLCYRRLATEGKQVLQHSVQGHQRRFYVL